MGYIPEGTMGKYPWWGISLGFTPLGMPSLGPPTPWAGTLLGVRNGLLKF